MEVALSNVGDGVDDRHFDPRASEHPRWRGGVCPVKTLESPRPYDEQPGVGSTSDVEERVKGAKCELTSKEHSKRMLLFALL